MTMVLLDIVKKKILFPESYISFGLVCVNYRNKLHILKLVYIPFAEIMNVSCMSYL